MCNFIFKKQLKISTFKENINNMLRRLFLNQNTQWQEATIINVHTYIKIIIITKIVIFS